MTPIDVPPITLSAEQVAVVDSGSPALVVVASAGSGKTEVVARRVERLLKDADTDQGRVLALTYTVKAAAELRDRLKKRLGGAARNVDVETLHGFAHSMLRQDGTNVGLPPEPELLVRDEDRAELLRRAFEETGREVPFDVPETLRQLDLARSTQTHHPLLGEWDMVLENAGALDYPGLLSWGARLLEVKSIRRRYGRLYTHVIVDEAQNLTAAQYRLLRHLVADGEGELRIPTMLVGDDKQSIVSFAGADPGLMREFAREFGARRIELTANFRSATAIARAAGAVAERLGHPSSETEFAAAGEVRFHAAGDEEAEAGYVAGWIRSLLNGGLRPETLAPNESPLILPEDVAVLARSSASLRFIAGALAQLAIPFVSSSTNSEWLSSLPGRVVMEILTLKTSEDHRSAHWQLSRLLGVPEEQVNSLEGVAEVLRSHPDPSLRTLVPLIAADTVEEFVRCLETIEPPAAAGTDELAAWQSDVDLLAMTWREFDEEVGRAALTWGNFRLHCARQQRGDDLAPGVRLLTIHKSQGREFRAVAVVGLNDGQLPDFRAVRAAEREAELRTFYVALSRARRCLLLTRPKSRRTRYGSRASSPSPFLELIPDVHCS